MENHLGELWSLFHFLMPGWLGREQEFARHYRTPIEKHSDLERLTLLRARVQPFLLRRTKQQVAPELPAKTEITQWVQLTPAQRDRYEALRLAMDSKVREEIQRQGLARSQLVILEPCCVCVRPVATYAYWMKGTAGRNTRPSWWPHSRCWRN